MSDKKVYRLSAFNKLAEDFDEIVPCQLIPVSFDPDPLITEWCSMVDGLWWEDGALHVTLFSFLETPKGQAFKNILSYEDFDEKFELKPYGNILERNENGEITKLKLRGVYLGLYE